MRVLDGRGEPAMLVIEVPPDGTIRASLGTTAIRLHPRDVRQLRQLYLEAMAAAFEEGAEW